MNNGRGHGQGLNVKDFTAEIDRATEPFVAGGTQQQEAVSPESGQTRPVLPEVGRTQTDWSAKIGQGAIFSTGEISATQSEQEANQEIQRDRAELINPEELVGEESGLQRQERLAEDAADLRAEAGRDGNASKNVERNLMMIADGVMDQVGKMIHGKVFSPASLMDLRRAGMHEALGVLGRRLGDRN